MRDMVTILVLALAVSSSGCGGGGGSPTGPSRPVDQSRASFTLTGTGYNGVVLNFSASDGNLIFCRHEPPEPDTVWIRFAQNKTANGDNSPRVDIDLCRFTGTGTYTLLHSTKANRTCTQGASFGMLWHNGLDEFGSEPGVSAPCTVAVTSSTGTLEGTFECHDLTSLTGSAERLDVSAGSFRCNF